jgi:hypothetical protein
MRARWTIERPRWDWRLEGTGRLVELERRTWSPGDAPAGFYLYVHSTEHDPGLFGFRIYGGTVKEAQRQARYVFGAFEAGRLREFSCRQDDLGAQEFENWCEAQGWGDRPAPRSEKA